MTTIKTRKTGVKGDVTPKHILPKLGALGGNIPPPIAKQKFSSQNPALLNLPDCSAFQETPSA